MGRGKGSGCGEMAEGRGDEHFWLRHLAAAGGKRAALPGGHLPLLHRGPAMLRATASPWQRHHCFWNSRSRCCHFARCGCLSLGAGRGCVQLARQTCKRSAAGGEWRMTSTPPCQGGGGSAGEALLSDPTPTRLANHPLLITATGLLGQHRDGMLALLWAWRRHSPKQQHRDAHPRRLAAPLHKQVGTTRRWCTYAGLQKASLSTTYVQWREQAASRCSACSGRQETGMAGQACDSVWCAAAQAGAARRAAKGSEDS